MAQEILLTAEAYKKKYDELEQLKTTGRDEIAERIKEARSFGDLSENSEYDAAKQEQSIVETEILQIEETLRKAIIIDDDDITMDTVGVGNSVTVHDLEFDEKITYKIVGVIESDPDNNEVSNESPIGSGLMGKKKGDIVTVQTPGGEIKMKILKIS